MSKILIAEDSDMMRRIAKMSIEKGGYQVFEAENGAEAVDIAIKENPDVILLDAEMPEMDGWEACKNIRKNPATANTPVIMCTGHDLSDEANLLNEVGATDYITKPYNPVHVLEKIKSVIK